MFWKYNNASSSAIDATLKGDVTLQELMDEEDIINECKGQNKALIDFLSKPEVMEELVTLTCIEPSPDLDEKVRFKYPNIACELLTCDVPALNERLAGDEALLAKLYAFLDSEPPLNPLLASFFSKIMGALIARKTEQNWLSYQFTCLQVLDFLKAKDNFISLLLKHIGTSAIMDLTLKLMTQVEGLEMRQNILNWLDSQNIVQSLVSLLDPSVDKERHYNVAQLLCDFIRTARDTQRHALERTDPDPLLNTIEAPETVSLLLDHILKEGKSESAIVGGIQVLLTLLEINKSCIPKYDSQNIYNSTVYDEVNDIEHRQKITQSTTKAVLRRLKDFHNLLLDPPKKGPIETTFGVLDPPLGNTRLHVAKLIANLILSNNADLVQELITLDTLRVLLDLFFKYQWNNFLHTQVELCITSALKAQIPEELGDSNALCKHLLVNCKLVERILGAWKENEEQESQTKGVRQGYVGHLINIVNQLVNMCSTTSLGQFLKDTSPDTFDSLEKFKETTLQEINKTQEMLLGGANPNTSNEDSDEYGDIPPFPQSALLQQQMFTQYQMQQLTPPIVDTYGFNDDDFNDGDEPSQQIDHRTNVNFDEDSSLDLAERHELFKQICASTINTLDDADDDIFQDHGTNFTVVPKEKEGRRETVYSSDSDEDSPPPLEDPLMDMDPWASSKTSDDQQLSQTANVWDLSEKTAESNETDWADFSSASFADFGTFSQSANVTETNTDDKAQPQAKCVNEDVAQEGTHEKQQDEKLQSSAHSEEHNITAVGSSESAVVPQTEVVNVEANKQDV